MVGRSKFSALSVWRQAGGFIPRHPETLPIAPLLSVPVLSDLLHSILIEQLHKGQSPSVGPALARALRLVPTLLRVKLHYAGRAVLWSLIPIYGWIRSIDDRLAWALASNVIVFEGLTSAAPLRARCEALAGVHRDEAIRVLVTSPLLFFLAWSVLLAFASSTAFIWVVVALFLWFVVPGSAAANTYLYLWMVAQAEFVPPSSPVPQPQSAAGRRWRYVLGVPVGLIVLMAIGFGMMVEQGKVPSPSVVDGTKLPYSDVVFLVDEGIIAPDEVVLLFYSTGLMSIEDDGNLLTDRRVISYERAEGELLVYALSVEEISQVKVVEEGGWRGPTVVEVWAEDGRAVLLYLAPDGGGDMRFVNEVQRLADAGSQVDPE